jgi:molybdenum cofactor biosynthesis enzyme MoaA
MEKCNEKNGIAFGDAAWAHIELSDNCNLRCIMCEQSGELDWHQDKTKVHPCPRGDMSLSLFKKILDDFVEMNVTFNEINPFWMGESLVNSEFIQMMKYLKESNLKHHIFASFKLHTNALALTIEKTKAILDCCKGFQRNKLSFSIDAIKPETFKRLKQVDGMEQINQNIKEFIKSSDSASSLKLILQFIVMEENFNEVDEFVRYWTTFIEGIGRKFQICHHKNRNLMDLFNDDIVLYFEKENTTEAKDAAAWARYNEVMVLYG